MSLLAFPVWPQGSAKEKLVAMINANCLSESVWKNPLEGEDPSDPNRIALGADLQYLLARAEATLEELWSRPFEESIGHGFLVPLFLEIERMIAASLHNVPQLGTMESQLEIHQELMFGLFNEKDPIFLRAALFKLLVLTKQLMEVQQPSIPDLRKLGDPIETRIKRAFVHLRDWFGFMPALFDIPLPDRDSS
jgi:hypothetical protein